MKLILVSFFLANDNGEESFEPKFPSMGKLGNAIEL